MRLNSMTLRNAFDGETEMVAARASSRIGQAEFEILYLELRDPVFRYLRRLAGDDDEAAELTSRTFERSLARLGAYRGGRDQFAAWLFRIARSQVVDAARRRRPVMGLDDVGDQPVARAEDEPESQALERERKLELAVALRQLRRLEQECLALRYGSGLNAREIGAVVGKSEAATQKLMSRALGRLREIYR